MVPKVAGKGRSFVGAGLYYLHDKKAQTSERVAFTHTENLPTSDPDKAIKCMAYTAIRQQQLKAMAGASAKGRKLEQPVYCYSLSWAPGEEPTRDQMIAAANETLKTLGLSGHEALFVGHNDEPHPHIHVIVNRVHPETGIAAKLSNDHLKLSKWAEQFERAQGAIRCEQRVENNALRAQGEFVKDRISQHAAEFHRWRHDRVERQIDRRAVETAALSFRHETERAKLRQERDTKIEAQRQRFAEANRGNWRDLFTIQRQERDRLQKAQRSMFSRLGFFARTYGVQYRAAGPPERKRLLKDALAALIGSQRQFIEIERKQKGERVFFAGKLSQRAERLSRDIKAGHDKRLGLLKERQHREGQELRAKQATKSKAQAREITSGKDKEIFLQEKGIDRKGERKTAKEKILQQRQERRERLRDNFGRAGAEPAPEKPGSKSEPSPNQESEFRDNADDVGKKRNEPGKDKKGKPRDGRERE